MLSRYIRSYTFAPLICWSGAVLCWIYVFAFPIIFTIKSHRSSTWECQWYVFISLSNITLCYILFAKVYWVSPFCDYAQSEYLRLVCGQILNWICNRGPVNFVHIVACQSWYCVLYDCAQWSALLLLFPAPDWCLTQGPNMLANTFLGWISPTQSTNACIKWIFQLPFNYALYWCL